MILHSVREWAESKGKTIFEPIILCVWCMPSIHAFAGYLFAFAIGAFSFFSWKLVFMYPLVAMASSFICGVSWTVYKLIEHREANEFMETKDRRKKFKNIQHGEIEKRVIKKITTHENY